MRVLIMGIFLWGKLRGRTSPALCITSSLSHHILCFSNNLQALIHFLCLSLLLVLSSPLCFFILHLSFHLLPLLFPLSLSPLRPCPRLSPSSAAALCRNSTLSHSERLTLPSCFSVLLRCCHGETPCVYAGACVCVWAATYTHVGVNYSPEAFVGVCVFCVLECVDYAH